MLISQEIHLQKIIDRMSEDIDNCEEFEDRLEVYKAVSNTTTKINQTREMLLKLEDRLFLNPTARVKSIPKTPEEKSKKGGMSDFLERKKNGTR
jgi:hypothetical protein